MAAFCPCGMPQAVARIVVASRDCVEGTFAAAIVGIRIPDLEAGIRSSAARARVKSVNCRLDNIMHDQSDCTELLRAVWADSLCRMSCASAARLSKICICQQRCVQKQVPAVLCARLKLDRKSTRLNSTH